MRRDARIDLFDALDAARNVQEIVLGLDRDTFKGDRIRRWAVERQLEIVGEALNRLRHDDPWVAARVPDVVNIIGFRNVLVHGYDVVDHDEVWHAITLEMPALTETLAALLAELDAAAAAPDTTDLGPHPG